MINIPRFVITLLSAVAIAASSASGADAPAPAPTEGIAPQTLFDGSVAGSEAKLVPDEPGSHGQVSIARSADGKGATVTIVPGPAGYPGVSLKPNGKPWDLSPFGHIEVEVTNSGTTAFTLGMRVDEAGSWQNNNTAMLALKPGETKTAKLIFGYSYGHPADKINTASIGQILLFGNKATTAPEIIQINSVAADGIAGEKMPIDPNNVRITPKDGILLGAGAETPLDATKNLASKENATATLVDGTGGQNLKITFPANAPKAAAWIKPEMGRWVLTDSLEVRAKVRNDGKDPITPTLEVHSNGGPVTATANAPLAPGAETELVASYINPKVWQNTAPANKSDAGTGNQFTSNQVSSVVFSAGPAATESTLTVESVKADMPTYSAPDWLGQRPPVDGEWTKTFDENFTDTAIDEKNWNLYTPNYWDKRTHFSKDDLLLGNGVVKLHYEKKTGFQADDPKQKQTDYASGYLDTYGKWVQRYGYFEARMKLPTAPGLWPAFWLMPDRGVAAGPQWKRSDTGNGGMEFDIMEFLSGWGVHRYNIAMHWDGYGKDHKMTGSDKTYIQPDKDGFITSGVLWTPGSAVYYCNGKEVLRYTSDRISAVPSFIMFDIVSGGWDNTPLEDAKLPDDFVIDYVRAWQRKDLASDADGMKAPPAANTPPANK